MKNLWLAVCFLFSIYGCEVKHSSHEEKDETVQKLKNDSIKKSLTIALTPGLEALPLWVAQKKHLFEKSKARVVLYPFTADMDCDTAFIGTTADGMMSDLIRTTRLKQKGIDVIEYSYTNAHWQLLANKKARLQKKEQFSDKKIAFTKHSALAYLTDKAFEKVKLKAPFFRIVINDVFIRRDMLKNNEIDAVWLKEPFSTEMRKQGHRVLADTKTEKINVGVIAFNEKKIDSKDKQMQLKAFAMAYNEACDSINKYGVAHYKDLIVKNCMCGEQTIKELPNIKYEKIKKVNASDVQGAMRYLQKQ